MSGKMQNNRKAVVSVSEMARMCNLSRSRFNQLLGEVFPYPIYDIRTKRPYYDLKLQDKCLEIRQTGIGIDGRYVLFYPPRKKGNQQPKPSAPDAKPKADPKLMELCEALAEMGLDYTVEQVSEAVAEAFPNGIGTEDIGVVIREVFRHIKNST